MLSSQVFLLVAALLLVACSAQVNSDRITNLPGLPSNFTTPMYSGYITLPTNNKHYFYFFIESSRSPQNDPVMLWLNGGPGCSSLGGLFSENGPFFPDHKGNLILNDYSWNKVANMLYIESPVAVGFSYFDNTLRYTDTLTANDNYAVLQKFFQLYPKFASNDFYISGESYAGHYIPQLAQKIAQQKKIDPTQAPQSNMKGFLVGNPAVDETYDFGDPLTKYYQTHAMLRLDDNNQNHITQNLYPYDILIDVCGGTKTVKHIKFPHPMFKNLDRETYLADRKRYVPDVDPCIDDAVQSYLNIAAVQSAIHANPTSWEDCGGPPYTFNTTSIIPTYKYLMDNTNYQMLVYSGDADTVINFISTEAWILDLKRPAKTSFLPWYYSRIGGTRQVGGMGIHFDRISFKTVLGSGHMVPGYQPAPAYQMLLDFLAGK